MRIKGGLGNQMFDYAFYLELKNRGRDVGIDLSFYKKYPNFLNPYCLTDVFKNIEFTPLSDDTFEREFAPYPEIKADSDRFNYLKEHKEERKFWCDEHEECGTFYKEVFDTKDCIFVGYWQSEKYFQNSKEQVRQAFEFSYGEDKLQALADELKGSESVSIQFRLANNYYEFNEKTGHGHFNIIEDGYHQRALKYVHEKLGDDIKLIVFSDEMETVKSRWKFDNAIYVTKDMFDNYQDWYDMYLISCCKGNIDANSTFTWWASWLNRREDKLVVVPKEYEIGAEMRDLYPEDWVKI